MVKRDTITPCKDCTERDLGCHGTCERYSEWKVKHQEVKDTIYQQKESVVSADRFLVDRRDRFRAFKYDKRRRR